MGSSEVENSWQQLAMELVVTIAENAPAMMRKHAKFLPRLGKMKLTCIELTAQIHPVSDTYTQ